jgi:peptidoglycan/LPS O-acetylase OafA/YrhL
MNGIRLSKEDSQLYKGIAIFMIAFHNFMHTFPSPKENEFTFSPDRINELFYLLWHQPGDLFRVMFSYFGHFGVQIFIFLSAYGLSIKYLNQKLTYSTFLKDRIIKLFPAILLAFITWALADGWLNYGITGPLYLLSDYFSSIIAFIKAPTPGVTLIPVGPWWFIPFIFEFYVIFPFMFRLHKKNNTLVLLLTIAFYTLFVIALNGKLFGFNIYFTILGHLPEFSLGIYFALSKSGKIKIPYSLLILSIVMFILGNIFKEFWYFSHFWALIILLPLFGNLKKVMIRHTNIYKLFIFLGKISLPLFLVNGFLLKPFITWAVSYDNWFVTLLLGILFFTVSVLMSMFLFSTEKFLRSKLNLYS